jgi:hypothetical protein
MHRAADPAAAQLTAEQNSRRQPFINDFMAFMVASLFRIGVHD